MKFICFLKNLSISIVLTLSACGGGGGGGGASIPTTVNASGLWQGTASNGYSVYMVVMPNNTFYTIYGAPTPSGGLATYGYDIGFATTSGNNFSGTLTDYLYTGQVTSGSFTASVVPGKSIIGNSGNTFNLTPSPGFNFNTTADIASISGSWTGTFLNGVASNISINNNGALSGTSVNCNFSGTVTPNSYKVNVFDASLTFISPSCGTTQGLTFTGIAIGFMNTLGKTQLILSVNNPSNTIGALFVAIR